LADSAPNFGYLLVHEHVLVMYGATAEALVFSDPNTAMIKCRQFGEALVARAFIQFGIPNMPSKQFQRLKVLADQGFLNARVRSWFDSVRTIATRPPTRATPRNGRRRYSFAPATRWVRGSTGRSPDARTPRRRSCRHSRYRLRSPRATPPTTTCTSSWTPTMPS
jgi:hypothetical protein